MLAWNLWNDSMRIFLLIRSPRVNHNVSNAATTLLPCFMFSSCVYSLYFKFFLQNALINLQQHTWADPPTRKGSISRRALCVVEALRVEQERRERERERKQRGEEEDEGDLFIIIIIIFLLFSPKRSTHTAVDSWQQDFVHSSPLCVSAWLHLFYVLVLLLLAISVRKIGISLVCFAYWR